MDTPYQLILDVWEGNPDIDPAVVVANGVTGVIVRINDINGGHHMDARFIDDWTLAKKFPVQAIYFVYNPWVSGQANYDWLMAHLPADYGRRRLFLDVEVRYSGISPATYAAGVARFLDLARAHFPATIYTCLLYTSPSPRDA